MTATSTSPDAGSIKFLTGPLAGRTFQINKAVTTIGREANNDIIVKGDQKVSRNHARILWSNGSWSIEKLSQQNILTVNQQQVQQATISDGNTIGLGEDTTFLFQIRTDSSYQATPSIPAYQQPVVPQQYGTVPQQQFPPTPPNLPYQQQSYGGIPSQQHYPSTVPSAPQQPYQQSVPQIPQQMTPYQGIPTQQPIQPQQSYGAIHTSGLAGRPDETQIASPLSIGIPTLEVSSNIHGARQSYPLTRDVISIGRDTTNDISIRDGGIVSNQHIQIIKQGNQFVLIHPHPDKPRTLNGLLYQGRKIRGDESFRKTLTSGDIFRIGDENGTLITLTFNDGSGTQQQQGMAPVHPIKLGAPELTIGRVPGNTLVLPHPQVSAHHARLVKEGGTYRILDMNSTNHVYVNSELTTNRLLKLGDEIRIGPYKLVYETNELTQYDESNFIRIDALNLKKSGNNNVTLLNDLSFTVPPRKFVALVGGSGAGKSTLMDALNGLRPAQQGKVLYNGQDYYRNLGAFSSQLGYVPQDDIVHRDLTVERALYYAAKLRLPSDFTPAQIQQRITEVLEDVEMTARRKLLVKKLSGGQRKRVSIALELLANPSIFFLDEPTSGLDPGLDRKMMFLLRRLADKGHTIVLVTHATNNINTCDYVCFLCSGGRLAFFGPPEEAKAYFGKTDFAEIYSSLEPTEENPNIPEEAATRFKVSPQYKEYVIAPLHTGPSTTGGTTGIPKPQEMKRSKKNGNPIKQFLLLSQRHLELLRNDTSNLIILLLGAPLLAILLMVVVRAEVGTGIFDANNVVQCAPRITTSRIAAAQQSGGTIGLNTTSNSVVDCNKIVSFLKNDTVGQQYVNSYSGKDLATKRNTALQDFIVIGKSINAQKALFLVVFIGVLFGCINGTREIVKEASIYRRERTINLGIIPYVAAKFVVLGAVALLQSAALLIIVQLFEPLHQGIILPVFLETYVTIVLTSLGGLLSGLAASAFAANEDTANSLLPILLIPQLLFCGVEIPIKDYILQVPAFLFPMRWAMAALGTSIGLHSDKIGGDQLFGSDTTYHGQLFSTFTNADSVNRMLLSWGALVGLIVLLIIVLCIGLKRKDIRV